MKHYAYEIYDSHHKLHRLTSLHQLFFNANIQVMSHFLYSWKLKKNVNPLETGNIDFIPSFIHDQNL